MHESVLQDITKQAEVLSVSEYIELIERLVHRLRQKSQTMSQALDWRGLYGLGKGLWSDEDGQYVWVGSGKKDGHLGVYNHKGRLLWRRHVGGSIRTLALSENGQRSVVGTEKGGIYIFNPDGTLLHQASAGKVVCSVAIFATGERIVAGSLDGVICSFQFNDEML